jgi:protein SCO1/2
VDNLVSVQRLLGASVGRDVFMYSFTLDPRHDTPAILADYARMHSVGPGWLFLGGKPAVLEDLRKRLGFVDPDPKIDQDRENHIGNVRYGNEARQLWGACPGMSRPEYIVESLSWVQARG